MQITNLVPLMLCVWPRPYLFHRQLQHKRRIILRFCACFKSSKSSRTVFGKLHLYTAKSINQ